MNFKSILKPEGSVTAALATAGTVFAAYNLSAGPISQAHATDPNHPALEASRKKAGYISFGLVSALFLITRDGNVAVIGYGSIVAMELAYRHGIMSDASLGKMVTPTTADFTQAENVVPMQPQAADYDSASGF